MSLTAQTLPKSNLARCRDTRTRADDDARSRKRPGFQGPARREKLGPERRQVGQALDAEPARKPTPHRGFRQDGADERKGQRHPDRALAFALADGEQLDGLGVTPIP